MPGLAEGARIPLLLDDLEDIRILIHALDKGVVVDLAEPLGEGDLLLGRELLVAEEDDEMIEPGVIDLGERFIVDVCEIDAADQGAAGAGDGLNLDASIGCLDPSRGCHGRPPQECNMSSRSWSRRPGQQVMQTSVNEARCVFRLVARTS